MELMEIFRELMDEIYFNGYTDEVLANDQGLFEFEYEQFLKCYS